MFTHPSFRILTLITSTLLLLNACTSTVDKEFKITGSNKNTGIIELSFDQGPRELGRVKEDQPTTLALERCKIWGYSKVKQTQAPLTQCVSYQENKCTRSRVSIQFQCK